MTQAKSPEKCPQCERELPAGAAFCPSCGARSDPTMEKRCPGCGRVVSSYSRFCPGCGKQLLRPPAQHTNHAEAPAPPTQKKGDGQLLWLGAIVLLILATVSVIIFGARAEKPAVEALPPLLTATTSKGIISVGQPAYVDGRSLDMVKPATRMQVPVWDDTPGTGIACYLAHGTPVEVREIRWLDSANRHYFRVEAGACWGWLPEETIGSAPQPAVGDEL